MSDTPAPRPEMPSLSGPALGDRLLSKQPDSRLPLRGQWELTCRCNLRCVMCYTDCFNTPAHLAQELTLPEIVRIMDEVQEAGCLELCLTGGEPLARKDFPDIYLYAKSKGFLVTVFTNGTLLTPKIADLWAAYPPTMIEISLHGLTKDTFEQVTQGNGSYDRCLAGIRLLLDRHLPLTLKATGLTLNREEILAIKRYVQDLSRSSEAAGGPRVQFKLGVDIRAQLDGSVEVGRYQLPEEEIQAIEAADPDLCAERDRQAQDREARRTAGTPRCGSLTDKFHIDAYGRLQLCSGNRRQSYDLRRGSFREGFFQALPQFPCPNRAVAMVDPLVTIERAAPVAGRPAVPQYEVSRG